MTTGALLHTDNLAVGYAPRGKAQQRLAEHIDVSLDTGELVCLIGPNGAGKSTLLRTLAGMHAPLAGRVLLMGDDVHRLQPQELAKRLSVVLTEKTDVGILSAYDLVALGRHPYTNWAARLAPRDHEVVRWALQAVGASDLAERSVHELSDGERQKLMIARALAQEPRLMILDEPTAFLDLPRRVEIVRVLRHLAETSGQAILLSTHDLDLALRSADRIWLLPMGGPLQAGAPEDLILSGAFEAAFDSESVPFDRLTGSFRMNGHLSGQIALIGEGVEAIWTRRALERLGFRITAGENGPTVIVQNSSGRPIWITRLDNASRKHESLSDLTAYLKQTLLSAR